MVSFKIPVTIALAIFVQTSWSTEENGSSAPEKVPAEYTGNSINELREQFKAAHHGGELSLSDIEGEWTCEFHYVDRAAGFPTMTLDKSENYTLNLSKKLAKKHVNHTVASDDLLNLDAEIVSHHEKAHSQIEWRMGSRRVLFGKASTAMLDEMAHDIDMDTVDEIAVSLNGSIKTLVIERSYFYKGPYQALSLESQDINEWKRQHGDDRPSTIRVPRAYSLCVRSI